MPQMPCDICSKQCLPCVLDLEKVSCRVCDEESITSYPFIFNLITQKKGGETSFVVLDL